MGTDVLRMQDPEMLLDGLNRSVLELLGLLAPRLKADSDQRMIEDLRQVVRRTFTIQLLHKHDFIAVTGSQGAGKTTLVSALYRLSKGYLTANSGLGEGLPVLILENPRLTAPRRWLHRIPDSSTNRLLERAEVDEELWLRAVSGSDSATLVAELEVPTRYFHGARRGFVLLPGFERATRHNRFAQTLMREALSSAQAAIIVTDRSRLADDTQRKVLEELTTHVSEPIIAVAKSEHLDEQARTEIAERAGEVFGIEPGRVVFTTADDKEWEPALLAGLARITTFEQTRQRQLRVLRSALDDLGNVENRVFEALAESRDVEQSERDQWEPVLTAYDEASKKVRRDVEKQLAAGLNEHESKASARARTSFGEQEAGVSKKIINFFKNEATLDEQRRARLVAAWSPDEARQVASRALLAAASTDDRLVRGVGAGSRTRRAIPSGPQNLPEVSKAGRLEIDSELADQLEILVRPHDPGLQRQVTEDLLEAIRMLPRIAVHVLGKAVPRDDLLPPGGTEGQAHDPSRARESILGLVEDQRAAMLGLAGLLGLDVVIDGDVDLAHAPAAIHAALVTAGLSSGAAAAVLGIAGAGLAAGLAVNQVNRMDRASLAQSDARIAAFRDSTYQALLNEVWDMLDRGHEALAERGRSWHRLDASTVDRLAAGRVLAEVRERRVLLERTISTHPLNAIA